MPVPIYDAAAYATALQEHLPRGRVWPRDPEATQTQIIAGYAPTFAVLHARAAYLLTDAFPRTTTELLPEWEATLGLPDPCAGEDQTIAQRQAHVVARLTAADGPSIASLTAYAAALGYTITIQEFAPSRLGKFRLGQRMQSAKWAHAWQITAPATLVTPFRLGQGRLGERFRVWGSAVIECEMERIKPAHTEIHFNYTGSPSGAPLGSFILGRDTLSS